MAVATAPNKIRICLDPKDLNTAVIPPKYHSSALDEFLPKLSRAKVFRTVWLTKAASKQLYGPFLVVTSIGGCPLVSTKLLKNLNVKLDGLSGVPVIRDATLVVGHGENEEEANQNHDENLVRLLEHARKVNLRLMNLRKSEVRLMGPAWSPKMSWSPIQRKLGQCRKCHGLLSRKNF